MIIELSWNRIFFPEWNTQLPRQLKCNVNALIDMDRPHCHHPSTAPNHSVAPSATPPPTHCEVKRYWTDTGQVNRPVVKTGVQITNTETVRTVFVAAGAHHTETHRPRQWMAQSCITNNYAATTIPCRNNRNVVESLQGYSVSGLNKFSPLNRTVIKAVLKELSWMTRWHLCTKGGGG